MYKKPLRLINQAASLYASPVLGPSKDDGKKGKNVVCTELYQCLE